MDIIKYFAWLLPALIGFAGNWLFKFTESGHDASGRKQLTTQGKIAMLFAMVSLALAGYTTHSEQEIVTRRALKAEEAKERLIAELQEIKGLLKENIQFVGSRAGKCSPAETVRFTDKDGEVIVDSTATVLVELESPREALVWYCGGEQKKTGYDEPFDIVRCERTVTGAVEWTFYRKGV
jgi:hypothetical protein